MNVRDLIQRLAVYPPEMEVVMDRLGTYEWVSKVEPRKGVPRYAWILKEQANMSDENKARLTEYVWLGTTL